MASKKDTQFKSIKNGAVVSISTKDGASYAGVFAGVEKVGRTDRACIQAANGDRVYVPVQAVEAAREAGGVDVG